MTTRGEAMSYPTVSLIGDGSRDDRNAPPPNLMRLEET